jgi:hypothetical protein
MLLAVAVASPGTIRLLTGKNAKPATRKIIRYRTPATLAVFLSEFISSLAVIFFSPFLFMIDD